MQVELNTAITVALLTIGLSLAVVVLFLGVAALGYFGAPQQWLAVSWLIGAATLATTIFLDVPEVTKVNSPNGGSHRGEGGLPPEGRA